jgi:predicted phosphodiesterase
MATNPIADALNAETPELAALREKVFQLEAKLLRQGDAEAQLKQERDRSKRLEREFEALAKFGNRSEPPAWTTKRPKAGAHHATPWLLLSDLHLDEVVYPEQIGGVNAYDREIAGQRLKRTADNFVTMCRDYTSNITYDGVVVVLGGDIFSGDIHEELKESNEDTMLGSVDYWLDPLASLIAQMAEEFGKVHVPVVVGNHGRTTRKPRAKFRARSNFDWFVGAQLARIFAKDNRVTFQVSESADTAVKSYDTTVMVTHGDQATGGSGIGGIWPPLMRLDARKRAREAAVQNPYDLLVMGHWHQLVYGPSFIVNGSLKGYDEYAYTNNFGFEPPQQAAWFITPEHGRTVTFPVFCQDRAAEGW